MAHDLIKERVLFNERAANDAMQLLIEGDVIVPDVKPDMALILKTEADALIDKSEVANDRVSFSGRLTLKVLYLAKGSKTVHSMSQSHIIDDFMNIEGVNREMAVDVQAALQNIEYKMLNDRKIGYKAVVEVGIDAEQKTERELVKMIEGIPDSQLKKREFSMNRTVESKDERFLVKEDIAFPPGKPSIAELLQSTVHISNKDVKVTNGRVSVTGDLVLYTLYRSDDEDSVLEFIETEIPFSHTAECQQARDGQIGELNLRVENLNVRPKENADGEERSLDVEASVKAAVKVYSQADFELLEDAYIVNKTVDLKKEGVSYPKLVCKNKNQCPVKEIVEIDADCPDILQIYRVSGRVVIDSTRIIDDKVIVEGIIETDILYIAKNDDSPLYNFQTVLPYRQTIETKGAQNGMTAYVEKNIDHVGFNMLSDREVELRFLISFNTKVISMEHSELVTDAEINDVDRSVIDQMPSIIVYVVQKGDSLWSIAKKYNVALNELAEINEIENKNLIFPGQKLLILKKITN